MKSKPYTAAAIYSDTIQLSKWTCVQVEKLVNGIVRNRAVTKELFPHPPMPILDPHLSALSLPSDITYIEALARLAYRPRTRRARFSLQPDL